MMVLHFSMQEEIVFEYRNGKPTEAEQIHIPYTSIHIRFDEF
jgi:hypothetical protein